MKTVAYAYLMEVIELYELVAKSEAVDLSNESLLEGWLAEVESSEPCVVDVSSLSSSSSFFTSFSSFPALSMASNLALIDGIMSAPGGPPVRGPISWEISFTMLSMQFASPKASLARLVTAFNGLKNRFLLLLIPSVSILAHGMDLVEGARSVRLK